MVLSVLLISMVSAWWSCLKGWAQDCISNLVDPNCHGSRGSHGASGGWVLSTGPWLISNVSKLPATFAWGEWSLFDEAVESSLKEFQQKNIRYLYVYTFFLYFWYVLVYDMILYLILCGPYPYLLTYSPWCRDLADQKERTESGQFGCFQWWPWTTWEGKRESFSWCAMLGGTNAFRHDGCWVDQGYLNEPGPGY